MVDDSWNAGATINIRKKLNQIPCFQRVVKLSNQHRILWEEEEPIRLAKSPNEEQQKVK